MKFYWYANCPNCKQGRLIITEDITNSRLYLHCEECERAWINPNDILNIDKSFLAILENFDTENPSIDVIRKYGWERFALYEFTE